MPNTVQLTKNGQEIYPVTHKIVVVDLFENGTTTDRPTLTSSDVGYTFFDTTVGKPIWWDGTNWVDATGTTV